MNKAILIGRTGIDPEIKTFDSGNKIAQFTFATVDRVKNKQGEYVNETTWHNIKAFGKRAETIEKYVKKGAKLSIIGKITQESWDKDGVKHYKTAILLDEFEMLDNKKETTQSSEQPQSKLPDNEFTEESNPSDDLPF
jgi:single-strand DNA-binding protein